MSETALFWLESPLATAIISWFAAQLVKVVLVLISSKKLDFGRFVGSGGMPSSHSALVCSLTTAIGCTEGVSSGLFAVCAVFSLVVMYDAAGVRRAAGQQAKILNRLVETWGKVEHSETEKKLKELLGHTPKEVFVGAILGIGIGLIRHLL